MKKKSLWAAVAGVVTLMLGYGVFASNMFFKLKVDLLGPGVGSLSGKQTIALPFNQQTSLTNAGDLLSDIPSAVSISRFVQATDSLVFYAAGSGEDFPLVKGEAYYVQVSSDDSYLIVGTHDPSFSVPLRGPQGGSTGTTFYAYPYHSVATTAGELINEINGFVGANRVEQVSKYIRSADVVEFYTGHTGTNFNLVPGEGYLIKVNSDLSFVPRHY